MTMTGAPQRLIPRWVPQSCARDGYAEVSRAVPRRLAARIRLLTRRSGVGWETAALAAHTAVLSALSGERAVLSGYVAPSTGDSLLPAGSAPHGARPRALTLGDESWRELLGICAHAAGREADGAFETVLDLGPGDPHRSAAAVLVTALRQGPDGPRLRVSYRTDVLDSSAADRIAGYYVTAWEQMAGAPDAPCRERSLLSDEEFRLQIHGMAGPDREVPDRRFHELFEEQVALRPDAVAAVHRGTSRTYAELNAAANRIAHALIARDLGPEAVVAVATERHLDWQAAVIGVLKAGAAYLPIEPGLPAERIARTLERSGCRLVLTEDGGPGWPAEAPPTAPEYLTVAEALAEGRSTDNPAVPVGPSQLAYLYFTSGSTGEPKGVEIGHGALAHFVAGATQRYELGADDRVMQFAPLHFDASVEEIFLTLCAGATLVVRTDDMTESVATLTGACERLRVSVLDLPTAYWHEVAYALATGSATLPASVRTVIIGGEAAVPERVDGWRRAVGSSVRLFNTYGPTEATVVATVADLHDPGLAAGDVPIGRPLPGTRAVLVPVDGGTDQGAGAGSGEGGTVGELHLLGDALARGYRGARTADAERFAPLTDLPGAPRAYRTGDLVRLADDGLLRFVGRVDGEFKISGHRVHPTEVEAALLRQPGLREAAVIGQILPDGTRRLVAHLVADGTAPQATEVREALRAVLPAAMIPSALTFHERLPLTGSGKIDRKALAALDAPAPAAQDADATPADAPGTTSANPLEAAITGVWAQVLGADHIAPGDDFFDLGAQSLQAIQVANRLGVELAREVKVAWLFQYPTAADLAAHLAQQAGPDGSATPAGARPAAAQATGTPAADATEAAENGLPAAVAAVARDAELEADIAPGTGTRVDPTAPPRQVLLTGATGFVGAHLLAELLTSTDAEVVCLVRAADREQATARLRQALDEQQLAVGEAARRIVAEPADLGRPHLGLTPERLAELAASCDAIFHNAATVSIMREYSSLRGANTESTRELLRLAADRSIPFHLVSTLSTAPPYSRSPEVPEAFLPPHPGLIYGYQQSKWASERLLEQAAERGLPVTLHRLGRVVGAPDTGFVNDRDFVWSVLRAGIPAGIVPDLFEAEVWTPVDYVARAVVRLALRHEGGTDVVFNHAPAPQLRLDDLYDWIAAYGYRVRRMPLAQWRAELPRAADVATTTLAFFDTFDGPGDADHGSDANGARGGDGATPAPEAAAEPELRLGHIRADNVLRGLADTGITCPTIDRSLVFRYLDHCVKTGSLPRPTGGDRPEPVTAG